MLTAAALLAAAFLFGGGGSRAGIANLVVQLAALIALAFHRDAVFGFFKEAPRAVTAVVAVTLLFPLLQCVPLPPAIWHQLPGRELAIEALALIGQENSWMPFSVNAQRTFIAFLALMPPLAILALSCKSHPSDRVFLAAVVVACGAAGVILGALQLATGNRNFILYAQVVGSQDLQGTFANRNTAGLFLDISLCALISVLYHSRLTPIRVGASVVVGLLLMLGLFLTRSRSSITLTVIPASILLFNLWKSRRKQTKDRSRLIVGTLLVVSLILSIGALTSNSRIQKSLSRFDNIEDARPAIWQDAQASIRRYWPLGSGIGTFDEVFQIDESLENLSPGRAARAHNEYLETSVESGILGAALVSSWIFLIGTIAFKRLRAGGENTLEIGAVSVFLLLALQSILDYPLRSETLLCISGLMLGVLSAKRPAAELRERRL